MNYPSSKVAGIAVVWMLAVSTSLAKTIEETGRECRKGQAKACAELTKIVTSAKNAPDRLAALSYISDTSVLSSIANNAAQRPEVSQAATARLEMLDKQARAQAEARAQAKLNADFRDAIRKGDIGQMNALAGRGADVNLIGRTYRDVEDLQLTAAGFRYRFKEVPGASLPMLDAFESARSEVVRALLGLGADVKTGFFDMDADINITTNISSDSINRNISLGQGFSIIDRSGTGIAFDGKVVLCSVRPTPARKATYLGVAQHLLAEASDAKRREGLQQIVDLLAQLTGVRLEPAASGAGVVSAQSLGVKPGQWETTTTMTQGGGGAAAMPQLPPGALDRLSQEQRARIEAQMKAAGAGGRTNTSSSCKTKEQVEKWFYPGDLPKTCSYTLTVSTQTQQKIERELSCDTDKVKTKGTVQVEVVNSEAIKGVIQITSAMNGQNMTNNITFTSKWVGPTCKENK